MWRRAVKSVRCYQRTYCHSFIFTAMRTSNSPVKISLTFNHTPPKRHQWRELNLDCRNVLLPTTKMDNADYFRLTSFFDDPERHLTLKNDDYDRHELKGQHFELHYLVVDNHRAVRWCTCTNSVVVRQLVITGSQLTGGHHLTSRHYQWHFKLFTSLIVFIRTDVCIKR